MDRKGFTLLELIIFGAIGSGLLLTLSVGIIHFTRSSRFLSDKADSESDQASMLKHFLQIGRFARSCQKITTPAPSPSTSLNCNVDFTAAATGPETRVRFMKADAENELHYEIETAPGNWQRQITYGADNSSFEVVSFDLCAEEDMRPPANASNCTANFQFAPAKITQRFVQLRDIQPFGPGSEINDRFFRFRIQVIGRQGPPQFPTTYQSAVYVRNPTRVAGLFYRWGGKD